MFCGGENKCALSAQDLHVDTEQIEYTTLAWNVTLAFQGC